MEMTGEQLIPASQQETWDALKDPEILKSCVPGCESIEKTGDNEYQVLMVTRVGPVSAKFKGKLALSDLDPPNSYSIAREGEGTRLAYSVKASVGGKLAQIGSRLVDAAAKKIAGDFFQAFNDKVAGSQASEHAGEHEPHRPDAVAPDPEMPTISSRTVALIAAAVLVVVAVCLFVFYG